MPPTNITKKKKKTAVKKERRKLFKLMTVYKETNLWPLEEMTNLHLIYEYDPNKNK